VRVKVVKNKVAPPFRKCEFDILYGEGISREGDLIDLGVEKEIIKKSGAWFSYGEERLGQGRENVRVFLRENTDLRDRIERQVLDAVGILKKSDATPAAAATPPKAGAAVVENSASEKPTKARKATA
jgi:recombination protein RecA